MGEDIHKWYIWYGLISKICKEHIQLNTKKTNIQLKSGQRIWTDTSPKRKYRWPAHYEKVLSISNHQAKASQIISKLVNNKYWQGCGEKGTLLYCWWDGKLVQPPWEAEWKFLRKLKMELPYSPAIPFWVFTGRKQMLLLMLNEMLIQKDTAPLYLLQHS